MLRIHLEQIDVVLQLRPNRIAITIPRAPSWVNAAWRRHDVQKSYTWNAAADDLLIIGKTAKVTNRRHI
jgi:ABC-type taurine transport system substrate-binding protein